ncbi:Tol-Pal system protein TolB [uncultured Helicobacter sp.]|uniref:Tol-Pal system protein TolB n=1 Tax=uncultured Helicobacter sp. TaxID=175537 RepID=UPI00262A3BE6|nr:Tol-Pal system protein TolB [uncultured Helicobacter sp.]
MKRILWVMLCSMGLLFGADATIDIIKSTNRTPKIEVGYIAGGDSVLAKRIYKVLLGDLNVSGHFEPIDGNVYSKNTIDFSAYQSKKIDLVGIVQVVKENKILKASLLVYDNNASTLQINKTYQITDSALYPFIAHKMAVEINAYIKAPTIEWMNRYVVFSQYTSSGLADIVLSDYTLTYRQPIITGGLNIFPKWADSTQKEIYYTKYLTRPTIVRHNIYTGKSEHIVDSDGMAAVSDISKDGKKLLITLAPKHQSDIYLFDVSSKTFSQLTKYSGIDVSGYFIDKERSMVFVSDRSGYANIYAKKLDLEAPAEQVVYHGRNNNSISAHGDYVAYSSRESDNEFGANTFNIYLISMRTDYIRRLTAIGNNQMPRFSKDGGSVMFLKHTSGQTALGVIRLDHNKSYLFPLSKANIQSFDW